MSETIDSYEANLLARLSLPMPAMQRAQTLVRLAEHREASGDVLRAEHALAQANQCLVANRDLVIRHCRILNKLGRWRESIKHLKAIELLASNSAAYWSCCAESFRYGRDWESVQIHALNGLKINPDSQTLRLLQACSFEYLGVGGEAESAFSNVLRNSVAVEMYAAALAHRGKYDQALNLLEVGLKNFAADSRLHTAYGLLKWMVGERDGFADLALAQLRVEPDNLGLLMATADLLRRGGRVDEALELLRLAYHAESPPALSSALSLLYSISDQTGRSLQLADKAVAAAPYIEWIRRNAAVVHLSANEPEIASTHCLWGLKRNPIDQEWLALDGISKRQLNDHRYSENFAYDKFVRTYDFASALEAKGEEYSAQTFSEFVDFVRQLHTYSSHPLDQSLRGGVQLPIEPWERKRPNFAKFFSGLEAPIRRYIKEIGQDNRHPFLSRNTGFFDFSGAWSVLLKPGGRHVSHIHPEGWISGVCYLHLPPHSAGLSSSLEGSLCFGEPAFKCGSLESDFHVAPEAGKMVLFPSYMWHGTLPFTQGNGRLTLAFDLVPI